MIPPDRQIREVWSEVIDRAESALSVAYLDWDAKCSTQPRRPDAKTLEREAAALVTAAREVGSLLGCTGSQIMDTIALYRTTGLDAADAIGSAVIRLRGTS